jgi:hypothetical protein
VYTEVAGRGRGRPTLDVLPTSLLEGLLDHLAWHLSTGDNATHQHIQDSEAMPAKVALGVLQRMHVLTKADRQPTFLSAWLGGETHSSRLPFSVWLRLVLYAMADPSCAAAVPGYLRAYRGLVLSDVEQLRAITDYTATYRQLDSPIAPIVVLLDLQWTSFSDNDALALKQSVGSTLAALRLDGTRITTVGVGHLCRSADDGVGSFSRLQYLSLRRLCALGDAAVEQLASLASLAALGELGVLTVAQVPLTSPTDLMDSACTEAAFQLLRRRINDHVVKHHYHRANGAELPVFATSLSLASTYARLRRVLTSPGPAPAQVHIRETHRRAAHAPEVKPKPEGGRKTVALGDIYSAFSLAATALAEDEANARGPAAFRVGNGGVIAGSNPVVRSEPRAIELASDMEEVDAPEGGEGFYAGQESRERAEVGTTPGPSPLLLFRKVQPIVVYVRPQRVAPLGLASKPPQQHGGRVKVEIRRPALGGKRANALDDYLGQIAQVAKRARPSGPLPLPTPSLGSKAQRAGLSTFRRSTKVTQQSSAYGL